MAYPRLIRAFTLMASVLAAAPAHANGPELQAIAITPAACEVGNVTAAKPVRGLGLWQLSYNGRASLLCSIALHHPTITSYRLLYRDPDGRGGNASVKAYLVVTGAFSPVTLECGFRSNFDGPAVGTGQVLVTVTCPTPVTGDYVELLIELWRRGPGTDFVGFGAADFP